MRLGSRDGKLEFVGDAQLRLALTVVHRRHDQHWRPLLEQLLNRPLSHAAGPLLELHFLYHPGQARSELFVVGDHVICDGISITALCAELLALCAGALPAAARPLLPPLTALLPPFSRARRALAFGRQLARLALVSAQRRVRGHARPGKTTRFLTVDLASLRTRALVEAARSEQTTVTAVLMAATLRAVASVRKTGGRLALSLPVNVRPLLRQRQLAAEDLGHLTSMVYLTASRGGELWPCARRVKRQLSAALDSDGLLAALAPTYELGERLLRPGKPPLAHALVSSSGIVPLLSDYGAFRVVDFFSASSAVMLSADFSFFCNTFDGRLRINLVYLQEVVDEAEAARVLACVERELTQL